MAVEDLTREGTQNQKRNVSVAVSDILTGTQINGDGCQPFTLPENSAIIALFILVSTAAGASDTVDINYAGSEVGSEVAADALGLIEDAVTAANAYSASGGAVVIKDGAQAVTTGFRCRLIVEYIELDKHTGEYTNMTMS